MTDALKPDAFRRKLIQAAGSAAALGPLAMRDAVAQAQKGETPTAVPAPVTVVLNWPDALRK